MNGFHCFRSFWSATSFAFLDYRKQRATQFPSHQDLSDHLFPNRTLLDFIAQQKTEAFASVFLS